MVFLVGGANSASGDYKIDNSVRFDDGAANGLSRFGNNSRNALTFTISFWMKRTELGAVQQLVNCKAEDSGSNAFLMTINADDEIQIGGQPNAGTTGAGSHRAVIETNNKLRDTSAWYHIVYRQDTTQSTAANRHILYINGVASSNSTYAELDEDAYFLYFYDASSFPYAICNDERDNVYGDYYMAEHHYCDGVSNAASAFGETNDNGVWIPKQYTGSHGTYGHYLKFNQSGAGSGTTAIGGHDYTTGSDSTIGADSSGNDHHFHVQGYSAVDNTTDTPTNNFATLSSIDMHTTSPTLAEGNLDFSAPSGTAFTPSRSTIAVSNGKWYMEYKALDTNGGVGIMTTQSPINDHLRDSADVRSVYRGWNGYYYGRNNGGAVDDVGDNSQTFSADDIGMISLDLDNGYVYFGKNGTWLYGQDGSTTGVPTSGSSGTGSANPSSQLLTNQHDGVWGFMAYDISTSTTGDVTANFGNPIFSISSGNADANGYGNFEYAVPSGYYALCTKNLAEYG